MKKVYNKHNKTIKGDRNMKFDFMKALREMQNQELSYNKIIFNYDILNDEDNNFRSNLFSDTLIEKGYIKSKIVDTFYEKNLKSVTKNDLKEEFRQEAEELKKKLKEVIKDYNQVNNTNIKINYRFDLSLDNENGKI